MVEINWDSDDAPPHPPTDQGCVDAGRLFSAGARRPWSPPLVIHPSGGWSSTAKNKNAWESPADGYGPS